MRVLKVFFLGLAFGWFLRWILDVIFFQEDLRALSRENALLKRRVQSLETPRPLQNQSRAAALPVEEIPSLPAKAAGPAVPHQDDLKMIKGVGPQIEKKLNNAGVYTFDQMSRLTTAELQSILGLTKRIVQNADNLLTQAKKFAEQGPRG